MTAGAPPYRMPGVNRLALRTAAVVLALAALPASASASTTWFRQAADIPTLTPDTTRTGDPGPGAARNKGGEAAAIFDANHDGIQDVVIANGPS